MNRKTNLQLLAGLSVMLLVFNLMLLDRLADQRKVIETLQLKVTPSLAQQFLLYEHGLQGESVASMLEELQASNPRFAEVFASPSRRKLLFYFPGENCRRSLHMEMQVFNDSRSELEQAGIDPVIVFSGFQDLDLRTMAQQFGIEDYVVADTEESFRKRFGTRPNPLILYLQGNQQIALARVSRNGDVEGSRKLYEKVRMLSTADGPVRG